MSRFLLAASLIASLSSSALADRAPMTFAKPPPAVATADAPRPAKLLITDRTKIRAQLAKNRAANLARFRAYQAKGVFPSNVYTAGAQNVWRDQAGNYCAAATIIRASGQVALVDNVAETDNFIRLADVSDGALMDWILTSGLTQAELALIQRPFVGVSREPEIEPTTVVAVDATLRTKETARLAKHYKKIEATLAKQTAASLDAAVDRLMAEDLTLAHRLVAFGS